MSLTVNVVSTASASASSAEYIAYRAGALERQAGKLCEGSPASVLPDDSVYIALSPMAGRCCYSFRMLESTLR
jgi:hypothetical protein